MQHNDKFISANALLEKIQYRIDTPGIIGATVRDMVATTRRIIEEAPAVDAVEVVRCRDCVYWENGKDYTPFCNRPEYGFHECPKPDDFCSYGERRPPDGFC